LRQLDVPALLAELKIDARRAGNEYRGHCPNPEHVRRPGPGSWQIRTAGRDAGLHTCYGCGFGGGPVQLVQKVLGLPTYGAAFDWIRQFVGEVVPSGAEVRFRRKEVPVVEVPELQVPVGTLALWAHDRTKNRTVDAALTYLEGRGLVLADVERYGIGAVPEGAPSYGGRLIVPVVVRDRLVDFVARLFVDRPATVPKALSGRRDQGAVKELSLWGYDELDPGVRVVHVVEGVWGAHAARRAGLPNVVASCGSAWSPERSALLGAWPEICFIPDGDAAGSKLPGRASDLRFRHQVRVAELPAGQQPDTVPPDVLLAAVRSATAVHLAPLPTARARPYAGK
jgi:DNA primase